MTKFTLSLIGGVAALACAAPALAQDRAPQPDMTRAAVQERSQQAFERMDANKDGKIDAADREARQKVRFDHLDADNNGQLRFAEMTAKRERAQGAAAAGQRAERGGKRDGARMAMRGHRGPGMMMRGGTAADADKDGAITLAEFQAAALARFDSTDADRNGTVTAAERKTQRDQMRQQWQQRRAQSAS
ncbi:hypothetical protein [Tsuneonella sp. HG222]